MGKEYILQIISRLVIRRSRPYRNYWQSIVSDVFGSGISCHIKIRDTGKTQSLFPVWECCMSIGSVRRTTEVRKGQCTSGGFSNSVQFLILSMWVPVRIIAKANSERGRAKVTLVARGAGAQIRLD